MFREKAASMIIGTLMGQEICPIHGQGSHSPHCKEKPPDGYMWSAEMTKRQATSRPDQLRSEKYVKEHTWREATIGWVKKQSSRMPENFEVFVSSHWRTRSTKRSSKMHWENSSSQKHLVCLVKAWMAESTEKPVAKAMVTSQNWRVSRKSRGIQDVAYGKRWTKNPWGPFAGKGIHL